MKHLALLMVWGVAVSSTACSHFVGKPSAETNQQASTHIYIQAPYDSAYAQQLAKRGQYSIRGTAWVQDQQGKRLTCAGTKVRLYAATPYLIEYYQQGGSFDQTDKLYISTFDPATLAIQPHISAQPYIQEAFFPLRNLTVDCTKEGRFNIPRVQAGNYFIRANILQTQGTQYALREINLTRLISVTNENLNVQLTHHLR